MKASFLAAAAAAATLLSLPSNADASVASSRKVNVGTVCVGEQQVVDLTAPGFTFDMTSMIDNSVAPVTVNSAVPTAFTFTADGPGKISISFEESDETVTVAVTMLGEAVNCVAASDDYATGAVGVPVPVGVLGNDQNLPTDGTVTITRAGGDAAGTVTFDQATGQLVYTAVAGEAGKTVTIGYKACAADGQCAWAIVHVAVPAAGGGTTTTVAAAPSTTVSCALPHAGGNAEVGVLTIGAVLFGLGCLLFAVTRRRPLAG